MAVLRSNYLPIPSEDVVKVTTGSGEDEKEIFVADVNRFQQFGFAPLTEDFLRGRLKAQPMKALISRDTKGFQHPLENSTVLIDQRIKLPIVINITFLIARDYGNSLYQEMEQFYNSGEVVQVYTKARKYNNLYVAAIPHEEIPDKIDAIVVDITFKEIQVAVGPGDFNPQNTEQNNVVDRGVLSFIDVAVVNLITNFG